MHGRSIFSVAALFVLLFIGCAKKPDDAALVSNIKSRMFSDQQLRNASLQVTSSSGQVTLTGAVSSDAARLDAYKIATQTPGVTKVNDRMTVEVAQVPQPEPAHALASASAPMPPSVSHRNYPRKHLDDAKDSALVYSPPSVEPLPEPQPAPAPEPPPPMEAAQPPVPQPPPPPPPSMNVQVPSNTTLTIRMIDGVDSQVNHAGEIFHASLEAPIVVDNQVVVPKGADVYVRLSDASSAGKFAGKSELHLELIKLEFQGQSHPLVSSTYSLTGDSRGQDTAKKVGGGAVLGAIIGAIAGGGKGAAIGAGVGAAGGGVYQGATHGKQLKIPSETKLDFQLEQPLTVTVMPHAVPATQ